MIETLHALKAFDRERYDILVGYDSNFDCYFAEVTDRHVPLEKRVGPTEWLPVAKTIDDVRTFLQRFAEVPKSVAFVLQAEREIALRPFVPDERPRRGMRR